jgi:hypothetical protein
MTPFLVQNPEVFAPGDCIFGPGIRKAVHVFSRYLQKTGKAIK